MKPLLLVALLGCLASVFATPVDTTVKWCVISDIERRKCLDLANHDNHFSCVKRDSTLQCIIAIKAGEADAITLNGGDIYTAGMTNYDLEPIIAEINPSSDTCDYVVAVVKKPSTFGINDLQGKKSCFTGLGDSEGWNIPIGTLLSRGLLSWGGIEDKPLVEAVREFFGSSCVPGAAGTLCQLCKGDCAKSDREPYYGDEGALRCLADDAGEVAFIKYSTVPDSEKANYELLCKDNSRAPLNSYKSCHLGRVPAHAVVSRKNPQLAELIWTRLNAVQGFNLFSSSAYAPSKNLMFTDSTQIVRVPTGTDSFLYLGVEFMDIMRSLKTEQTTVAVSNVIRWCAVGHAETAKCDMWSTNSMMTEDGQTNIECQSGSTVEECMKKIMTNKADAMAVDGGQVYTAGKCGLIPVMYEQYDEVKCPSTTDSASSYYAVAVIKKGSGVTWGNLQGKRSCHTGMGRTAGWNIPMGQIHKQTRDCDFTKFFSSGCAPGADPNSPFCAQCAGSGKTVGDEAKCKANAEEKYFGYAGAFRCLVDGAGDVAFIKHTIVSENSNGNGPDWARALNSADYELICPDKDPVAITEFASCHLASVPSHAVISRPESRSEVIRILKDQQVKFGKDGSDTKFRMFQSDSGKNLLFKDSTKCLQEVQIGSTYESFLGNEYMTAMRSLRECSGVTPDLEKSCTFHTCQ